MGFLREEPFAEAPVSMLLLVTFSDTGREVSNFSAIVPYNPDNRY